MAVNPSELAEENFQRERIDIAGSPSETASDPTVDVQLAGLGKAILNLLTNRVGPVKPTDNFTTPKAGRVPTPTEEALLEKQPGYSYRKTQEDIAPQVLSPPKLQEFKQRDYQAFPPENVQGLLDLANDAIQREEAEAKVLAEAANKKAKQALTAEKLNYGPEAGVVDQTLADRYLALQNEKKLNIDSLKKGGPFNFEYIEGNEDLFQVLTTVQELYSDEAAARTRGIISQKQTMKEAAEILSDELGWTRTLLKRKIGDDPLNAAKFVASRELLVRSATRLISLAEEIKAGKSNAETQLKLRRQLAIHVGIQLQLKGSQAEVGRALNSFSIKVGTDEMQEVMAKELADLVKASGGAEIAEEMAEKILDIGARTGNAGLNRFALKAVYAKTKHVLHEAYLVGLLSNPATQIKNIVGTGSFMLYQIPAEFMAGVYGSAIRQSRKALGLELSPEQVYIKDVFLRMKGWKDSFVDAWQAAGLAYRTELPGIKPNKLDVENYAAIAADPNTIFGKAINELGKRARIPFRLLLGADEFFKVVSQRGELYTRVNHRYEEMLRSGSSVEDAEAEALMLLLDPMAISDDLNTKAQYDTMQSDLGLIGKFTKPLQNSLLGRFILPFSTAPTNSMLKLTEFSPIGFGRAAFSKTSRDHQMMMGRAALGSATMYYFATQAVEGKITGSMPRNKKEREALPPNWKPYSFVLRGDNFPVNPSTGEYLPLYRADGIPNGPLKYVSYAGFEPVGAIIGVSADLAQRIAEIPGDKEGLEYGLNAAGAALATTVDYYRELPMLQGISEVITNLERQSVDSLLRSFSESSTVVGFPSPVSGIQRAGADLLDPVRTRPRLDVEYYTIDDVEQKDENGMYIHGISMGKGLKNVPDYSKVGTVKDGMQVKFLGQIHAYMKKDSMFFDEKDLNAVVYDTLGNEKKASEISFAVNPVAAVRNRVLGVRIEEGVEPTKFEKELMKLHHRTGGEWPLANRETLGGINLSFGMVSDWTNLAKNKTLINYNGSLVNFREAMDVLIESDLYKKGKPGEPPTDFYKLKLINTLEKRFYDESEEKLFELHPNLEKSVLNRAKLKNEGKIK